MKRVHGALHVGFPFRRIEYEKLWLRAEQRTICDTGGLQVFLGPAGNGARIPFVALHGGRLNNVTGNVDGTFFGERIDNRAAVVRHKNHVGFVDAFPARDGGAVKHLAFREEILIDFSCRNGDMLLFAPAVGEAHINPFDFVLFNQINCLGHCVCSISYPAPRVNS